MRSLSRVALGRGARGDALPAVFGALEERSVRIRRGQVTLVAAPPNSGKSLWAQAYAILLAKRGIKTLYYSADTDEHDTKIRAAAMVTGDRTRAIEEAYLTEGGANYYDGELSDLDRVVRFDFRDSPTYEDIEHGLLAWREVWGVYPDVVVVDNLSNIQTDYEDEWRGLRDATRWAKHVARATNAAMILLHHVNETKQDPTTPASRKDITGKVSQHVETVLTLQLDQTAGALRIAAVKNRGGKSSPSGEDYAEVFVDPDRCQFFENYYNKRIGFPIT